MYTIVRSLPLAGNRYAGIKSRELLLSPARRERPAYSWYDLTNNNGLPQRLHKRLKQDVSVTDKVTCSR